MAQEEEVRDLRRAEDGGGGRVRHGVHGPHGRHPGRHGPLHLRPAGRRPVRGGVRRAAGGAGVAGLRRRGGPVRARAAGRVRVRAADPVPERHGVRGGRRRPVRLHGLGGRGAGADERGARLVPQRVLHGQRVGLLGALGHGGVRPGHAQAGDAGGGHHHPGRQRPGEQPHVRRALPAGGLHRLQALPRAVPVQLPGGAADLRLALGRLPAGAVRPVPGGQHPEDLHHHQRDARGPR
mmetsp:Transcript_8544/g.14017  ORF Transcript_8544/g.14017 Transcript_8544/m.14017 type:complete len:237 (+) Transcript_8544:1469-2179(+)